MVIPNTVTDDSVSDSGAIKRANRLHCFRGGNSSSNSSGNRGNSSNGRQEAEDICEERPVKRAVFIQPHYQSSQEVVAA